MAETWRTIADSEVDPESPVTTSLAQAWRDNPEGVAAGVAGAPRIQDGAISSHPFGQGDIANSAVGRGELKTTTGTLSVTRDGEGTSSSHQTLPGGQYGFYPESDHDSTSAIDTNGTVQTMSSRGAFGGYSADIYLETTGSNSVDTDDDNHATRVRQRYVQSSPPYNLGDGECGLFIEVNLNSKGEVVRTYVAPDPVWANNGPTDIRPDYTDKKTGKKYKRIKRPQVTRTDVEAGRADLQDLIAAKREAPVGDVEITPEFKNADMNLHPHSWVSPPQGTICMLDSVQTHDLLMLHEDGEDIADLLHKGFILPGDEVSRHGPPGVKMISFKWKRSKR